MQPSEIIWSSCSCWRLEISWLLDSSGVHNLQHNRKTKICDLWRRLSQGHADFTNKSANTRLAEQNFKKLVQIRAFKGKKHGRYLFVKSIPKKKQGMQIMGIHLAEIFLLLRFFIAEPKETCGIEREKKKVVEIVYAKWCICKHWGIPSRGSV